VVSTPDMPPTVSITNPAPNASFQAPATVSIEASASDSDGTVTNVQFLLNGALLANVASAPYGATAADLGVGSYILTAIASDNAGLRATNSLNITVSSATGPAVTISGPIFNGNSFTFSFATQLGVTYSGQFSGAVESTNNWSTFTNLIGTGNTVRVTDSVTAAGTRFYRVVTQ
jgi:Bacterial Ig domain